MSTVEGVGWKGKTATSAKDNLGWPYRFETVHPGVLLRNYVTAKEVESQIVFMKIG